ncbi:MAG TPA: M28 family peptidase [Longimicrobiales bacterium]|nr:M28 family peptidase [Longimicrobiales bacterium]
MRSLRFLLLASLGAGACTLVGRGGDEFGTDERPDAAVSLDRVVRRTIQPREIRQHVGFLASDRMRGRDTPSPELERAASWIAERFAAAGLEPAGDDGGYIQFLPREPGAPVEGAESPVTSAGRPPAQVPNVVGVVPGSDGARAGEYVILIAHFDHVGVGTPNEDGDSIFNGADDNASGTAALVAIAQAFGVLRGHAARPILFLATSGKEKGLLGASWFAAHPTVFLDDAVAVLNLDRIGRSGRDTVGLVGHDSSSLGPLVVRTAAAADLRFAFDHHRGPGATLFTRGDHYPFARRGIPAIAITTALRDDEPGLDDEPSRIDADKVARIARLVFLAAYELAMGEDAEWTEEGRRAVQE